MGYESEKQGRLGRGLEVWFCASSSALECVTSLLISSTEN